MDDIETKPWYASKGVWGGIVTIAAVLAGIAGIEIDAKTQALIVDQGVGIATALVALAGSILSIWGRVKAVKAIK
jgi:hypothetical protein